MIAKLFGMDALIDSSGAVAPMAITIALSRERVLAFSLLPSFY